MTCEARYPFLRGTVTITAEDETLLGVCVSSSAGSEEGTRTPFTDRVNRELQEYAEGRCRVFSLRLRFEGTEFQKKVWKELMAIPYGETRTYQHIARRIGSPGAAQAVGAANSKNPFHVLVPCHRVIASNGSLAGYAGGVTMKKRLLALEQKKDD